MAGPGHFVDLLINNLEGKGYKSSPDKINPANADKIAYAYILNDNWYVIFKDGTYKSNLSRIIAPVNPALNVIPPITDPLGKHWDQPYPEEIRLLGNYAIMTEATCKKLATYDHSTPTGVYVGKMFKQRGCLVWFGVDKEVGFCSNNYRTILVRPDSWFKDDELGFDYYKVDILPHIKKSLSLNRQVKKINDYLVSIPENEKVRYDVYDVDLDDTVFRRKLWQAAHSKELKK